MPRYVDFTTFRIAAAIVAERVMRGRMRYSEAEIGLLKLRAGPHYERLDAAEDEAARALSQVFRRIDGLEPHNGPLRSRAQLLFTL